MLPEDYYGWSSGGEGYTLGPRAEYPALDEIPEDDLRYFQMETESWRRCVKLELEHRRKMLHIGADTQVIKDNNPTSTDIEPIQWKENTTGLIYLFERLYEEGFITRQFKQKRWKLLSQHFVDEEGNPLKNLRQGRYNIKNTKSGKPRDAERLDSIIEDAKQQGDNL